jgi:hypothetical protein
MSNFCRELLIITIIMVYHCAALDCTRRTGSDPENGKNFFHKFPTDLQQRARWVRLTKRDFVPNRYHRLCSKHFVDGEPTTRNPYPTLFSHNNYKKEKSTRRALFPTNTSSADVQTNDTGVSHTGSSTSTTASSVTPRRVKLVRVPGQDIPYVEQEIEIETTQTKPTKCYGERLRKCTCKDYSKDKQ